MAPFVARRIVRGGLVILCAALVNFGLLHLAPGDLAVIMAGESGGADSEYIEQLRTRFGLNDPLLTQLGLYLLRLLQFDLGYSFRNGASVFDLICSRLPATLLLMGVAISAACLAGTILGAVSARRIGTLVDHVVMLCSLLAYATPILWLGPMLILLFSVKLGWLPTGGMQTIGEGVSGMGTIWDVAVHVALPALTLGLFYMALYARLVRASVLQVAQSDFVRTARAKGVRPRAVMRRHILRNALLPTITLMGLQFGSAIGGAVVVETVFSWPGIGRLAFDAVVARDLNLMLGILLISSILVVAVNTLTDLTYACLDPRIELS